MNSQNNQYDYIAFISYKRDDAKWAKWLQRKLESYKLPTSVRKYNPALPEKIRPVFRDSTNLGPGYLFEQIQQALDKSKFLIVICSPNSANSVWVSKEVQSFIDSGRADFIIPFIIDGTPNALDSREECFPECLRQLKGEQELLGANINEMGKDVAAIKVIARMFDLKFELLWNRYERLKRKSIIVRWTIVISIIIALLCFCSIIWNKNIQIKREYSNYVGMEIRNALDNYDYSYALRKAQISLKQGYNDGLEWEKYVRKLFEEPWVVKKTIVPDLNQNQILHVLPCNGDSAIVTVSGPNVYIYNNQLKKIKALEDIPIFPYDINPSKSMFLSTERISGNIKILSVKDYSVKNAFGNFYIDPVFLNDSVVMGVTANRKIEVFNVKGEKLFELGLPDDCSLSSTRGRILRNNKSAGFISWGNKVLKTQWNPHHNSIDTIVIKLPSKEIRNICVNESNDDIAFSSGASLFIVSPNGETNKYELDDSIVSLSFTNKDNILNIMTTYSLLHYDVTNSTKCLYSQKIKASTHRSIIGDYSEDGMIVIDGNALEVYRRNQLYSQITDFRNLSDNDVYVSHSKYQPYVALFNYKQRKLKVYNYLEDKYIFEVDIENSIPSYIKFLRKNRFCILKDSLIEFYDCTDKIRNVLRHKFVSKVTDCCIHLKKGKECLFVSTSDSIYSIDIKKNTIIHKVSASETKRIALCRLKDGALLLRYDGKALYWYSSQNLNSEQKLYELNIKDLSFNDHENSFVGRTNFIFQTDCSLLGNIHYVNGISISIEDISTSELDYKYINDKNIVCLDKQHNIIHLINTEKNQNNSISIENEVRASHILYFYCGRLWVFGDNQIFSVLVPEKDDLIKSLNKLSAEDW